MIDFHCHLDLFKSPTKAAEEADAAGVYLLSVTTTPKAFLKTAQIGRNKKRIRTALGLHPQLVHERHKEVALFLRLISETKYVGEIGLDGGAASAAHMDLQKEVFEQILKGCRSAGGRVMSIHSRHASSDVIDALSHHRDAGIPILHWFSGSDANARRAVDLGAWFSVGLPMLKSRRASSLISILPRDRILTETDAPFAATGDAHYPAKALAETVRRLAILWKCEEAEVNLQLKRNLRTLGARVARFN
ncbi:Qat anti-phage system TatD family nuclease QatD [Nitratireductor sp. CH_MIT9313-5]|uniref:Qat anti-phage system TatD family nuclease QatD n=1 Tax=Nitratireductor sp. CH_MIT9313-5 TaxID=3107764 RepID=UPI003FA59C12